jgi:hypothetical protein
MIDFMRASSGSGRGCTHDVALPFRALFAGAELPDGGTPFSCSGFYRHEGQQGRNHDQKNPAIAAFAIVLFGGSAFGQQQYDNLGSPTPRPNPQASPTPGPNVPIPGDKPAASAPTTTGSAATDGSGSGKEPAPATQSRAEREGYGPPGGPPDDGRTPSGLTPD